MVAWKEDTTSWLRVSTLFNQPGKYYIIREAFYAHHIENNLMLDLISCYLSQPEKQVYLLFKSYLPENKLHMWLVNNISGIKKWNKHIISNQSVKEIMNKWTIFILPEKEKDNKMKRKKISHLAKICFLKPDSNTLLSYMLWFSFELDNVMDWTVFPPELITQCDCIWRQGPWGGNSG